MPKDRDYQRAIDCRGLDCKHLYFLMFFRIHKVDAQERSPAKHLP
ncbi:MULTISPECIES: hypothetical protein [unclassified Microcoleus]